MSYVLTIVAGPDSSEVATQGLNGSVTPWTSPPATLEATVALIHMLPVPHPCVFSRECGPQDAGGFAIAGHR